MVITVALQGKKRRTVLKRGSLNDRLKELEEISKRKVESHPLRPRRGCHEIGEKGGREAEQSMRF